MGSLVRVRKGLLDRLSNKATRRDGHRPRRSPAERSPAARDWVLGLAERVPAEMVASKNNHQPRQAPTKTVPAQDRLAERVRQREAPAE